MNTKVQYVHPHGDVSKKENAYLQVRDKEGRILSDEEVINLPYLDSNHPLKSEWKLRERSYLRLIGQLKSLPSSLHILDVGCGNGWFTGLLSKEFPKTTIYGIDLNEPELEQANRLFGSDRVHFLYLDLLQDNYFRSESIDVILFNASIQYFPVLKVILEKSIRLLKSNGYIWVNDSPFYKNEADQKFAKIRSQEYYSGMGCPEMSEYYYHHLESDLLASGFQKVRNLRFWKKFPFSLYKYKKYGQ